jgi:hypothetical protein
MRSRVRGLDGTLPYQCAHQVRGTDMKSLSWPPWSSCFFFVFFFLFLLLTCSTARWRPSFREARQQEMNRGTVRIKYRPFSQYKLQRNNWTPHMWLAASLRALVECTELSSTGTQRSRARGSTLFDQEASSVWLESPSWACYENGESVASFVIQQASITFSLCIYV